MSGLERDPVYGALTRPVMFAGVSYSYFVLNIALSTEIFLILRSPWTLAIAAAIHVLGYAFCRKEPRFVDLWLLKIGACPRVRNYAFWRCNSYSP